MSGGLSGGVKPPPCRQPTGRDSQQAPRPKDSGDDNRIMVLAQTKDPVEHLAEAAEMSDSAFVAVLSERQRRRPTRVSCAPAKASDAQPLVV